MKELEKVKSELIQLITERIDALSLVNETPKYEQLTIGWWYTVTQYSPDLNKTGRCKQQRTSDGHYFDFDLLAHAYTAAQVRPATQSEIQSALTREAEKKYAGKKIKCLHDCDDVDLSQITKWDYDSHYDCLRYYAKKGCGCAYAQGQWATTLIKDEVVTIGSYKAVYENDVVKFGEYSFTRAEVKTLERILSFSGIKSLNVGCTGQYTVSRDTVEKVLKGFK